MTQLSQMQYLTALTLFGKSAQATPYGHRLAAHLTAVASMQLVNLCMGLGARTALPFLPVCHLVQINAYGRVGLLLIHAWTCLGI